jgi:hypothetical protein
MGPHHTPARRRRGATAAATALAVASASIAVFVLFVLLTSGTDVGVVLADEARPPATVERTATERTGSEPTGTEHTGTDPRSVAPPAAPPSPEPATATRVAPHALERSEPASIVIPALDVDAEVMELGLRDDGTMEVPPHAPRPESRAGWFRHSPTPGELGPSVIVGHVDSDRHGASVFYGLDRLADGDRVEVRRADGHTAVFEVEHVAQYGKDEFPTEDVYGNIDHAGLRLITCGGVFDPASVAYEDNIVVYARFVASDTAPDAERR